MHRSSLVVIAACLCLAGGSGLSSDPETADRRGGSKAACQDDGSDLLKSLVGTWEGTSRTWFRPGQLADESKVKGEFKTMLGGRFLRHTYEGTMKGKPRTGEETIVYNPAEAKFQVAWFDSFHMSYGILFSEGEKTENGFCVKGQYRMAPDQEPWGWKTVFEMIDPDHLTITAYNILPSGQEAKGVETVYVRTTSK